MWVLFHAENGGTSLDQWQPGGLLFDHACYMSELASRTSTISAVLWHQGEADCAPELYPLYEQKLTRIINEFRKRLNLYDVPFLLGALGDFLPKRTSDEYLVNYTKVNDALKNIAANNDMINFVPAVGLEPNPDNLHFCAKSLREFGIRYYREFVKIEDKNKVFVEKSTKDSAIINSMERL